METINNVATAAAKAVWGDSEANREPVSGVKGDTARGEPYDAGNLDPNSQHKVEEKLENEKLNGATTGVNTETSAAENHSGNGLETESVANPSTTDTTSGQNDTRSPEETATTESKSQDVDTTTLGPTSEGNNFSTKGPKPVETVAQERGGDAGNDPSTTTSSEENKDTENSSESKGTGEEYVKSSGLQADGGDFDATKPGAGREADRLMGQKGMHRDEGAGTNNVGTDEHSGKHHGKDKPSLGERIKAKLHKH